MRHHNGRRRVRFGRGTPTSKQGRLEPKRAAARGSRKERRRRGAGRNLNYRLDFGAREPRRASALFALVERRSCEWRSLCGRRTSLRGETEPMPPDAPSIAHRSVGVPRRAGEAESGRGAGTAIPRVGGWGSIGVKRRRPCRLPPDAGSQSSSHTRRARPATW